MRTQSSKLLYLCWKQSKQDTGFISTGPCFGSKRKITSKPVGHRPCKGMAPNEHLDILTWSGEAKIQCVPAGGDGERKGGLDDEVEQCGAAPVDALRLRAAATQILRQPRPLPPHQQRWSISLPQPHSFSTSVLTPASPTCSSSVIDRRRCPQCQDEEHLQHAVRPLTGSD